MSMRFPAIAFCIALFQMFWPALTPLANADPALIVFYTAGVVGVFLPPNQLFAA